MPLKSKASTARAARATPPANDAAPPADTTANATVNATANAPAPGAAKATSTPENTPAGTGTVPGAVRKARTPNQAVADRRAAQARMKEILAEVKTIKKDQVAARKAQDVEFAERTKDLETEYGLLTKQIAKNAFS